MLLRPEVRNGGRNSHTISNYLVSLSQAEVGNEGRMVITFLLVMKAMLAAAGSSKVMSPVMVSVSPMVAVGGGLGGGKK